MIGKLLYSFAAGLVQVFVPSPCCEVDGIKFWREGAFKRYLKSKDLQEAKRTGNIHAIVYVNGYSGTAKDIYYNLIAFLDEHDGNIIRKDRICFRPMEGEVRLTYQCDKEFNWRKYI